MFCGSMAKINLEADIYLLNKPWKHLQRLCKSILHLIIWKEIFRYLTWHHRYNKMKDMIGWGKIGWAPKYILPDCSYQIPMWLSATRYTCVIYVLHVFSSTIYQFLVFPYSIWFNWKRNIRHKYLRVLQAIAVYKNSISKYLVSGIIVVVVDLICIKARFCCSFRQSWLLSCVSVI